MGKLFGVGHKLGHYTGTEYILLPISCNYWLYFQIKKSYFKVAHVMTNPNYSH